MRWDKVTGQWILPRIVVFYDDADNDGDTEGFGGGSDDGNDDSGYGGGEGGGDHGGSDDGNDDSGYGGYGPGSQDFTGSVSLDPERDTYGEFSVSLDPERDTYGESSEEDLYDIAADWLSGGGGGLIGDFDFSLDPEALGLIGDEEESTFREVLDFLSRIPVVGIIPSFVQDVMDIGLPGAAAKAFANVVATGIVNTGVGLALGPAAVLGLKAARSLGLTDALVAALPEDLGKVVQGVLDPAGLIERAIEEGRTVTVDTATGEVSLGESFSSAGDGDYYDFENAYRLFGVPSEGNGGPEGGPGSATDYGGNTRIGTTQSQQASGQTFPGSPIPSDAMQWALGEEDQFRRASARGAPPSWMAPLWDKYVQLIMGNSDMESLPYAVNVASKRMRRALIGAQDKMLQLRPAYSDLIQKMSSQPPVTFSFAGQKMGQFVPYRQSIPNVAQALESNIGKTAQLSMAENQARYKPRMDALSAMNPFLQTMRAYSPQYTAGSADIPDPSLASQAAGWIGLLTGGANLLQALGIDPAQATSSLLAPLLSAGGEALSSLWDSITGGDGDILDWVSEGGDNWFSDAIDWLSGSDGGDSWYDIAADWLSGGGGSDLGVDWLDTSLDFDFSW